MLEELAEVLVLQTEETVVQEVETLVQEEQPLVEQEVKVAMVAEVAALLPVAVAVAEQVLLERTVLVAQEEKEETEHLTQ